MDNLVFISIASALYYGINSTRLGYSFTSTLNRPLVIGLYLGIVFGDIPQCMILAGSIQALYIGMMGSGGIIPSDASLATIVAIPIAMLNGLDATTAISLALPVGLLGSILVNVRYMINGLFVSRAEACADACDGAGIIRNASLYPALVSFLMYFPIVFVSVFFGTGFVENVVAAIPEWLSHGLSVAGGWLPAIGFALTIMVIDQPKLIPIFIIGFFMVQYLNFGVMACAIFAICISLFVTMRQMDEDERRGGGSDDFDDFDDDAEADAQAAGAVAGAQSGGVIGPRGAAATFLRWYIFCEMSHSYERMQGISWGAAFVPALAKMYPNPEDKEHLAAAYRRQLSYFNTQGNWGGAIVGVVLAMEESQAASRQMTIEETNAAVNGLKTGFMGPIAGVGDVIDWATISTILLGLGLPFASQGSWIGAAIAFLIFPITISEGFFFTNLGYSLGTKAMDTLLTSGLIDKLIASTGMIGMFMMGALGSTYVKVALANAEAQATLDAIIPGILSLALIFLLNRIIVAHKDKVAWISFGIIGVCLVGALIGIL